LPGPSTMQCSLKVETCVRNFSHNNMYRIRHNGKFPTPELYLSSRPETEFKKGRVIFRQ
jgi:hypothetical protein